MLKSAFAAVILAATAVAVQAQQVKLEDQVKFRRAAYTLMNLNFGSIAAMVQDKKPYNQDEATRNADFVAMLSTVPRNYFGEGTDQDTKAKPASPMLALVVLGAAAAAVYALVVIYPR